jgi:hypothetical protein
MENEKEDAEPLPDGVLYGEPDRRISQDGMNTYDFILKTSFRCPRHFQYEGATYRLIEDESRTTFEGYYTVSAIKLN